MATTLSTIVTRARRHLVETTASFWSDAELTDLAIEGCEDLWKMYIDTFQDYFLTVDETNVTHPASSYTLTGVPSDVFRIKAIEPRDLNSNLNLIYRPLDYAHPDFLKARAEQSGDASGSTIYYDIVATGPPVGAPTIYVAPKINAAVTLRLVYIPTLGTLTSGSNNPFPGYSDKALVAYVVAFARAKEREDRSPDPEWLAIYQTEKQHINTVITPRQEDEDDYAEALFEQWWSR